MAVWWYIWRGLVATGLIAFVVLAASYVYSIVDMRRTLWRAGFRWSRSYGAYRYLHSAGSVTMLRSDSIRARVTPMVLNHTYRYGRLEDGWKRSVHRPLSEILETIAAGDVGTLEHDPNIVAEKYRAKPLPQWQDPPTPAWREVLNSYVIRNFST